MSASEIQSHLRELHVERALASTGGLAADAGYLAELDEEIAATRDVYVAAAVTEIAVLRGELSGPQVG